MAANEAADRTPLQELISRAQDADRRMSRSNPHRLLIQEMAVSLVALAQMNAELLAQIADKPRIVLP